MADKVREAGCPDGYGDRHAAKCENAVVAARVIEGAWGDGYIAGRRAALDAPLAAPSGGDATRDEAVRAREEFAGRFQQVTSPVMAKGVEDTAFYVYTPLASVNDVGGGPASPTTRPRSAGSTARK